MYKILTSIKRRRREILKPISPNLKEGDIIYIPPHEIKMGRGSLYTKWGTLWSVEPNKIYQAVLNNYNRSVTFTCSSAKCFKERMIEFILAFDKKKNKIVKNPSSSYILNTWEIYPKSLINQKRLNEILKP